MVSSDISDDFDLNLASHVQQLLFPKSSPYCDWACIGVKNLMARGLGGDYFDFIAMPDGCQAVFVGDVTGHGVHASVVMALLYGYIHRASQSFCSPVDLVREINAFLQSFARRSAEFDHYFSTTLFCASIDPLSLRMEYVNAGHPAPLVRRGDDILSLPATSAPVGFFDAPEIQSGSFRFHPQDRLLLYTDGITESSNPAGELFGTERLQQVLREKDGDYRNFLNQLFAVRGDFAGDTAPEDDCTAIVIDFHTPRGGLDAA
ncbi:PP2C family protein-serine/threonine phosphatase [Desulfuromonas carbonis]|uniref:PP2C family protein-serine/threonine phosphatase n=1 Tax=Desulfuromonas sp. DDH964 TaxID=1823759 RepID=UPI00078D00FB|nr:PP2C family protein-serine/threonine phosphatase [Desulfuromonas sp. DDH964]AMV71197.1 serine phosphatase, SpoIIE domain-containing [Desulfuromonas sp. DDH964]